MTSTILISPALSSSSIAGWNARRSSPSSRPDTRIPVTPSGISGSSSIIATLFRLVQLDEVADRVVQNSLVPGAGDGRDSKDLDAVVLQVGDCGINVVDSDR